MEQKFRCGINFIGLMRQGPKICNNSGISLALKSFARFYRAKKKRLILRRCKRAIAA
jgi:hypothetical protein